MEVTLKKFVATLFVATSVLTLNQAFAAVPSGSEFKETSINSIASTKLELTKAAISSQLALKSKVRVLLGSSSAETIAVALTELGISPSLSLQSLVEAGVPVTNVVGFLVAANPENAPAIVAAALKIHPEAEVTILQAAINAGASPDGLLPATAAGSDEGRGRREGRERIADSRRYDREYGGGGGVITPPPPISKH